METIGIQIDALDYSRSIEVPNTSVAALQLELSSNNHIFTQKCTLEPLPPELDFNSIPTRSTSY